MSSVPLPPPSLDPSESPAAELCRHPWGLTLDIWRHGIAQDPQAGWPDADRALTKTGIQRTQAVIRQLKSLGYRWDRVLTSPYQRAHQTAQLALDQHLASALEVFPALAPGGSFADLAHWQQQHPEVKRLAIVGHQPDLSRWILLALGLDPVHLPRDPGDWIPLKKAGLARIKFPTGHLSDGSLSWILSPKVLLGR
jgi:phosphohistidine phosphatase